MTVHVANIDPDYASAERSQRDSGSLLLQHRDALRKWGPRGSHFPLDPSKYLSEFFSIYTLLCHTNLTLSSSSLLTPSHLHSLTFSLRRRRRRGETMDRRSVISFLLITLVLSSFSTFSGNTYILYIIYIDTSILSAIVELSANG